MKLLGGSDTFGQQNRSQDDAAVGYVFQRHPHEPEFPHFAHKAPRWASGDEAIIDVSAIHYILLWLFSFGLFSLVLYLDDVFVAHLRELVLMWFTSQFLFTKRTPCGRGFRLKQLDVTIVGGFSFSTILLHHLKYWKRQQRVYQATWLTFQLTFDYCLLKICLKCKYFASLQYHSFCQRIKTC